MRRRLRVLVVLGIVVVLVAGAAVVVFTTKPDLDDKQERVDARWRPLRKPLQLRYQVLAGVEQAVTAAGGGERAVIKDLRDAFDRWAKLAGQPDDEADPRAEAETANELEALAARLRADVNGSERLKTVQPILAAIAMFDSTVVPPPAVRAYNRAVHDYQDTREGTLASVVVAIFGYDDRPTLVVGG